MLNYENVFKLFDNFNESTDNYPGVMFMSIYREFPTCYCYAFDKSISKVTCKKFIDEKTNITIKRKIDDRVLLRHFLDNSEQFEVIAYSSAEYLILGKNEPFLTIIDLHTTADVSVSSFQIIYATANNSFYDTISKYFIGAKEQNDLEFGIAAVDSANCLYTNYYDFKKINVNIKNNYNDDLPYNEILNILNREGESALLLFYGDPGTGKSSLIKKLISEEKDKDFVFMDGTLLANVQQDKLMSYFLENQDTVFIFEDCEKILLNRDHNYNPTMSILLNLTDGIISDVLNIKIICTFNTALSNIDKALLRKGRLKLKYEFRKLDKEKVRKLLKDDSINQDMTLADVYHYKEENDYSKKITNKIGF